MLPQNLIELVPGVETALVIEDAENAIWDHEADVLVVGFGGAGVCAALQTVEQGGSVIVLDRFGGGGSTAYSGGVTYAGGTRVQAEAGCTDSSDAMFDYLSMEVGAAVSKATLRTFCDGSAADVEWLIRYGVPFNRNVTFEKTAYPADDRSLYFSGNEKVPRYKAKAAAAPRGHRAVGVGFTGHVFYGALQDSARKLGVEVHTHTPVRRLLVTTNGRVVGVEADSVPADSQQQHQELYCQAAPLPFTADKAEAAIQSCRDFEVETPATRRRYRARGGVILAAGGFIFNLKMLNQYRPDLAEKYTAFVRLGNMGDDGAGIALGASAGGEPAMLENVFVNKLIAPPDALLKCAAVNASGARFINEDAYCGYFGSAISVQPGGKAWLIVDRNQLIHVLAQCLFGNRSLMKLFLLPIMLNILRGGTRVGGTIGRLARKCGIDGNKLLATIKNYNMAASSGVDAFGKAPEHLEPVVKAPYFAINASLNNKYGFAQMFTLGGLRVDETTGAVQNASGAAIAGLYAAGRNAVGLCSEGYLSGMSLADCVFSGRRAARSAAKCAAVLTKPAALYENSAAGTSIP